ncbi:MAG: hypothetical protein GY737_10145 [Desulfobacteraceae bacterium]|nr:hypothetical protein [Desulfobacteraceae bacterium]
MKNKALLLAFIFSLLFFGYGCRHKSTVCDQIPDAENSIFHEDGTLFITGGKNMYKISKSGDGQYESLELFNEQATFSGMAIYDHFLYVIYSKIAFDINYHETIKEALYSGQTFCEILDTIKNTVVEKKILVADLDENEIVFTEFCTLEEMFIPNGMAVDSTGRLYVTDETFVPLGKILRISKNQGVIEKEIWMDKDSGAVSPNGIAINNDILYFTDLDLSNPLSAKAIVKRVDINGYDTGQPDSASELYKRTGGITAPFSLFDDLAYETILGLPIVIVTDYNHGSLLFIEDNNSSGRLHYETSKGLFASPSSVVRGMGPDFSNNQLIVTEKGILLLDPYSDFGNKIVSIEME